MQTTRDEHRNFPTFIEPLGFFAVITKLAILLNRGPFEVKPHLHMPFI
jgi:hypothetical protein